MRHLSRGVELEKTLANSMQTDGLFSVVIPVYKGERFIRTALESALSQTYKNIEIVVINDGSPDSSREIVGQYGNKVVLIDQKNAGVAAARNAGIKASIGEFVGFLDQDDYWQNEKVALQVEIFNQHPQVGVVHTQVQYFDIDTGAHLPLLNPNARSHEIVGKCKRRLLLGNGMYNSSVALRRSVLETVGECDLTISGNTVQDYDLWLRCADQWEFEFIDTAVSMLGIHTGQGLWNRTAMLTQELKVLLKHLPEQEWLAWTDGRHRLATLYSQLATAHLDDGNLEDSHRCFSRALQLEKSTSNAIKFFATYFPLPLIRGVQTLTKKIFRP